MEEVKEAELRSGWTLDYGQDGNETGTCPCVRLDTVKSSYEGFHW